MSLPPVINHVGFEKCFEQAALIFNSWYQALESGALRDPDLYKSNANQALKLAARWWPNCAPGAKGKSREDKPSVEVGILFAIYRIVTLAGVRAIECLDPPSLAGLVLQALKMTKIPPEELFMNVAIESVFMKHLTKSTEGLALYLTQLDRETLDYSNPSPHLRLLTFSVCAFTCNTLSERANPFDCKSFISPTTARSLYTPRMLLHYLEAFTSLTDPKNPHLTMPMDDALYTSVLLFTINFVVPTNVWPGTALLLTSEGFCSDHAGARRLSIALVSFFISRMPRNQSTYYEALGHLSSFLAMTSTASVLFDEKLTTYKAQFRPFLLSIARDLTTFLSATFNKDYTAPSKFAPLFLDTAFCVQFRNFLLKENMLVPLLRGASISKIGPFILDVFFMNQLKIPYRRIIEAVGLGQHAGFCRWIFGDAIQILTSGEHYVDRVICHISYVSLLESVPVESDSGDAELPAQIPTALRAIASYLDSHATLPPVVLAAFFKLLQSLTKYIKPRERMSRKRAIMLESKSNSKTEPSKPAASGFLGMARGWLLPAKTTTKERKQMEEWVALRKTIRQLVAKLKAHSKRVQRPYLVQAS